MSNDNYEIATSTMESMTESMSEMIRTVSLAISLIAGISLLVGGIGTGIFCNGTGGSNYDCCTVLYGRRGILWILSGQQSGPAGSHRGTAIRIMQIKFAWQPCENKITPSKTAQNAAFEGVSLCFLFLFAVTFKGIFPDGRMEQDQQWKQLQPAGQHIKHQYKLGKDIELSEVLCWSYLGKTGSHIIDGGENCGKVGDQILILEGDRKDGKSKNNHKRNKKYIDGTDDLVVHRFALHINFADALWMDITV